MSRKKKQQTNWAGRMKKILDKYNLGYLWNNPQQIWNLDGHGNKEAKNDLNHKRFIKIYMTKIIFSYEEDKWRDELVKKSKLRTYIRFKKKLILEKYLLTRGYFTGRSLMTQVRTGTNKLEIEMGRHWRKKKKEDDDEKEGKDEKEKEFKDVKERVTNKEAIIK